ncbi:MAG: amidohydrolase family protein [Fastidiosipilaceae bacterium]|jgi:enamidase|nr:amidohydrolase family protein [Clostridiaceae bacterium]
MSKILIKNIGCLYTGKMDQPKLDANSILINDKIIEKIGNDLTDDEATVIDAKGTTVMPGLLDSHTHPVVGSWTPRQESMNWIEPYVRSGVTGLVSVGETHIPGKPKNAEGMRGLATTTKHTFTNVRPAKMKVYAGAYILHKDAVKEDFKRFKEMGCHNTGEIGLGSANTVETASQIVEWAKEAGIKVTIHRGGAYLHGSNFIDVDTIVALNPDVICHVSLGRVSSEEINRFFDETTSVVEVTRPQLGSMAQNKEVVAKALSRNEPHRVIVGNDCPSGFGLYPHGIWEMVTFFASSTDLDVGQAIACASGNTAAVFELENTGTIEENNFADLVICDAPLGSEYKDATDAIQNDVIPGISIVMIDGECVAKGDAVYTAAPKNAI